MESLWENSLRIGKDVWIILVNFVVIAIAFSEKKLEALLSYCHSYMHMHTLTHALHTHIHARARARTQEVVLCVET
jgi:hypothetical protein